VAHGDARAAVAAIHELIAMGDDGREAMGCRATGIISASFSSAGLLGRFCDILDDAGRPSR
jgi:hypothetical protein